MFWTLSLLKAELQPQAAFILYLFETFKKLLLVCGKALMETHLVLLYKLCLHLDFLSNLSVWFCLILLEPVPCCHVCFWIIPYHCVLVYVHS